MKFKTGNGNQPSPASYRLSHIMVKFNMFSRPCSSALDEHLWQWTDPVDPSSFDLVLLHHVGAQNLPGEVISKARLVLDSDGPFASYTEYLMCTAAFSTEFSADMARRTAAKGKTLLGVAKAACTYSSWGSYMNNCHMRTHLSGGSSALQPVGSTANEAFHAELGAAFRQVYSIHPPILRLRLEYLVLSKQVVFECAIRVQGLRQRRPTEILFLALARPLLDEMSWSSWCDVDPGRTFVRKETLPSRKVRLQDVARVRLWSAKKNPVAKPKKKVVKRTSRARGVCTSPALEHTGRYVASVLKYEDFAKTSFVCCVIGVCASICWWLKYLFVFFSFTSIVKT